MLEPRSNVGKRTDLTYLGGTASLDLWWRTETGDDESLEDSNYRLRIVRISAGTPVLSHNWDMFKVPMDTNPLAHRFETNEQGYAGYFSDVLLSELEMYQVDAYLRCFAPWTLGEGLTDA
jgi:hypothetical protein